MKFALLAIGFLLVAASGPAAFAATTTEKCSDDPNKECIKLQNPLQNDQVDVNAIIGIIIKGALGVVGALTLLMFVWGGNIWLTSGGNSERIAQGAKTMLWAAIGLFLVFISYLFLNRMILILTGKL